MEQNHNPSLSASALSSRMESASGDVPPLISAAGASSGGRSAAPRVPSMPGGLPPLPTFKALLQWDRRNVFSPPRSDTSISMPPQCAEESFSSLMGQAAGGQPQSPFQSGFPGSMGWGMPHEHAGVPRMQRLRSFDDSVTGGRVHMGVAGEDGRAAMQTSNMEVGLHGQAEMQRGAFGGGGHLPTAPSPDRMDFAPQAMEDGDSRRPSPNAGAQDACNGPVEDIAGMQAAKGMATAGVGETGEGSKNTTTMSNVSGVGESAAKGKSRGNNCRLDETLALPRYLEEEDAMHVNRPRRQQMKGKKESSAKIVEDIALETRESGGGISAVVERIERTPVLDRRKDVNHDLSDEDTQTDDGDSGQPLTIKRQRGAFGKNNETNSSEVNSGEGGGTARKEEGRQEGADVTNSDEQMLKVGDTTNVKEKIEKQAVGASEGGPGGVKNSKIAPSVTEGMNDVSTAERKSIEMQRSDIDTALATLNTSLLKDDQAAGQKNGRRRSNAERMSCANVTSRKNPSALEDNGPLWSTGGGKPQVAEDDGGTQRAVDDLSDVSDKSGIGKGKDSIVSMDGKQGSRGQKRRMNDDWQEVDLRSHDEVHEVHEETKARANIRRNMKDDVNVEEFVSKEKTSKAKGRGVQKKAPGRGGGRGKTKGGRRSSAEPTESLEEDGSGSTNEKRLQDNQGGSGEREAHNDGLVGPVATKVGENGEGGVKRRSRMKACFALTGDYREKEHAMKIIKRLKGRLCRECNENSWKDSATHLILEAPKWTEKVFAAVAGRKWLLQLDYLLASHESGYFVEEWKHEWFEECTNADDIIDLRSPRKWREQRKNTGCGAFHELKVVFYGAEGLTKPPMDTLKRAIHSSLRAVGMEPMSFPAKIPLDEVPNMAGDFALVHRRMIENAHELTRKRGVLFERMHTMVAKLKRMCTDVDDANLREVVAASKLANSERIVGELQDEVDRLRALVLMLEGEVLKVQKGSRTRSTSMASPSSPSGGTVASVSVSFCQQGAEAAVRSHGRRTVGGAGVHGWPCSNPGTRRSPDTNRREIDRIAELHSTGLEHDGIQWWSVPVVKRNSVVVEIEVIANDWRVNHVCLQASVCQAGWHLTGANWESVRGRALRSLISAVMERKAWQYLCHGWIVSLEEDYMDVFLEGRKERLMPYTSRRTDNWLPEKTFDGVE
ncbi:hypothetical protein CBR_g16825 [Chara braunii]|uniref:BRCT domain-containing protein n=1 Tax=Chara braunii TaxID=69332 RepID=A0A388KTU0_CHABU|nr:hypothetical protein CBR_g16825 [Chara braunii]|eukprot:GBG73484.1 hypothetical protein CBR_g16825 [Chara braunii]